MRSTASASAASFCTCAPDRSAGTAPSASRSSRRPAPAGSLPASGCGLYILNEVSHHQNKASYARKTKEIYSLHSRLDYVDARLPCTFNIHCLTKLYEHSFMLSRHGVCMGLRTSSRFASYKLNQIFIEGRI
jgi:hypothetical protein